MDPDIPQPSVEHDDLLDAPPPPSVTQAALQVKTGAEAVPLPPSSPARSPFSKSRSPSRPQSPRVLSRSPSSASSYNERQASPSPKNRPSTSNLSAARGVTPSRTAQYRRASSNLNPASPVVSNKAGTMAQEPERKVLTPSMVAKTYFSKELGNHAMAKTDVTVFVHDSCYGHRFSRPRTTKLSLASIVERPERIHASLLGASTAYVRLGGRHADSKHGPHPDHEAPSSSVPFRVRKTTRAIPLDHPAVTHVHGLKWMEELQIMCDSAESKLAMSGKELARPIGYGKDESGNKLPALHEGDLYLCSESLNALQGCLGGLCDAVDAVFSDDKSDRAFVCIRPPGHHCSSNFPSGFCWLNNVHVGITYAAMTHGLTHAAIIDFDLHHGDGSQAIAWSHNHKAQALPKNAASHKKIPIGYYSLHDINSYPCEMGDQEKVRNASLCIDNAHNQSIWNVHLEPWATPSEFWKLYETKYLILLEKARKFLRLHSTRLRETGSQPKAAIFLSAGFDACQWEMPGMQRHGVNVPTDFYARFTADVVKLAQEDGLGVGGRVISVLEGGYSDRALMSGVLSHICGLVDEPSRNVVINGHGGLTGSILSTFRPSHNGEASIEQQVELYDANWWSVDALQVIEALVAGNLPPPPTSKKDKDTGNYASPTQASDARMVEIARERRSLSAQLEKRLSLDAEAPPPPPPVDWAVASYELSRLIIPSDRQTLSFRHDELNAEATKARRERKSNIGVATSHPVEQMQLRERKAKAPPLPAVQSRSSSRNGHRRTTLASVSDLPDPSLGSSSDGPANRPRRRSSGASSIVSGFSEMNLADAPSETGNEQKPSQAVGNGVRATGASARTAKTGPVRKTKPITTKPIAKPKTSPKKGNAPARNQSRPTSPASDRTANSTAQVGPVKASGPTSQASQSSASANAGDDIEHLTNAMKKTSIKLKMPTEAEHEAKQKRLEDEQKKTTKAAKRPAVQRAPRSKTTVRAAVANPQPQPQPVAMAESVATETQGTPTQLSTTESASAEAPQTEIVPSEPQVSVAVGGIARPTPADEPSVPAASSMPATPASPHVSEKPALPPAPATTEPVVSRPATEVQEPATAMQPLKYPTSPVEPEFARRVSPPKISPAYFSSQAGDQQSTPSMEQNGQPSAASKSIERQNANTGNMRPPSAPSSRPLTPNKRTKADLPTFTSSSPIPFAQPQQNPTAEGTSREQTTPSIWDIPETPQK